MHYKDNKLTPERQLRRIKTGFFILEISTALMVSAFLFYALFYLCATSGHWLQYAKTYQYAYEALQRCLSTHHTAHGSQLYDWGKIEWYTSPCIYESELSIITLRASWFDAHKTAHTISMEYGL